MNGVKEIEKELSELPEGWIVLLETRAEKALEISLFVLKVLIDKNYNGIILSASRPYSNLVNIYQKNNINTQKIFILDCVSKTQVINLEKANNVLYLENVSDLTNISLSIDEANKRIKVKKFVFIDSITTMLIHNEPRVFARFIHYILTKMRINGINGLLISLERETNREIRAEIAQLCDKVIRI